MGVRATTEVDGGDAEYHVSKAEITQVRANIGPPAERSTRPGDTERLCCACRLSLAQARAPYIERCSLDAGARGAGVWKGVKYGGRAMPLARPLFPDERAFLCRPGRSETCHERSFIAAGSAAFFR